MPMRPRALQLWLPLTPGMAERTQVSQQSYQEDLEGDEYKSTLDLSSREKVLRLFTVSWHALELTQFCSATFCKQFGI